MTPPDHTPYLRPGVDLITAEDAAQWLEAYASEVCGASARAAWGEVGLWASVGALRTRLDRERRQACRRGALAMWRDYRASLGPDMDWDDMPAAWVRRQQERHRNAALAYRAAARAR